MSSIKAMLPRRAGLMLMKLRGHASRSSLVRIIYFGLRRVAWRARALLHLGKGFLRTQAQDLRVVRASEVFDAGWYASRYGDAIPAGMDALLHYMRTGYALGYRPNALFDVEWYLKSCPDVALLGVNPLTHYVRFGAREGRRPTPLFDSAWYLAIYADVRNSGANPLAHFLRFGNVERRDPCALFSSLFYLTEYQDVATTGINPLVHYIESGAYEGRDPNPYFSSAWYLSRNPAVASSGRNPLEHYIFEGWRSGRQPGPNFDSSRYLSEHPDIASAGIDPLEHFLRAGAAEQRAQPVRRFSVDDLLPSTRQFSVPLGIPVVDVIIPVYRGIGETSRCIDSVFAARCTVSYRLIVINDCSPEPEMYTYLEQAAERYGFTLLVNETNLGFVGTVNRGMSLSDTNDVLLLNSDTEVSGDWLDRIVAQGYARDRIATVTPLSNNATICSYPDFAGRRTLSPGISLACMDEACSTANSGRYVDVPTGVGFCMLIRRACLDQLGLFDEEAFGKGYGEENDFCMRAAAEGWENILALDTFVFHAGEVSFAADSTAGKARGMDALLAKHPRYLLEVASHVSEDPGRAYRAAITAQLWRAAEKPVYLLITHSLGGGTERHVRELASRYADSARVLILRPSGTFASAGVTLESVDGYDAFSVNIAATDEDGLLRLFAAFPIDRIHIHHLFGYGPALSHAVRRSGIPFEFTLHDYFTVCPQINLSKDGAHYCGEPDDAGCNACIIANPKMGARDIRSWRSAHAWVLRDAQRVIAPSIDAAQRVERYAPDANAVAIYHEEAPKSWREARAPRKLSRTDTLRVAVIGVLAPHKGRALVVDAALEAKASGVPVEFIVIGDPFGELPPPSLAAIRTTGRYKEGQLPGLLAQAQPDLILFGSQWPETYSYTLSAALDAQLPVLVPDIGAFGERVAGRPWSFEFNANSSGKALAQLLGKLREAHFMGGGSGPDSSIGTRNSVRAFGPSEGYATGSLVVAHRPAKRRVRVLAVLEAQGDVPSPCAHIRLVPYLEAMQRAGHIYVRYVRAEEVDAHSADIIVTHRVSVGTVAEARSLAASARSRRIPLIYDLDDNLYDLDPLAENGKYRPLLDVVHSFVEEATTIWVSTPILAERLREAGARDVQVHRNQLDPGLWEDGLTREIFDRPANDPVRIVYMGTRTHGEDFEMIAPALRDLKRKHGAKVSIELIGVRAEDDSEHYLDFLTPPSVVGASYPSFVSWITNHRQFDIGLSPLRPTPFNRCKSEIKVLDYAALGAVAVVSDIEPYHDAVTDGVDGFLVKNDVKAWLFLLDKLVMDPVLRHKVARMARARDFVGEFREGVVRRQACITDLASDVFRSSGDTPRTSS